MKLTLRNDFHNTEATVILKDVKRRKAVGIMEWNAGKEYEQVTGYITFEQAKRAEKKLCGMSDCACSGRLGIRGNQDFRESEDVYDGYWFLICKEL